MQLVGDSSLKILHVMEATVGGTRRHLRDLCSAQLSMGDDVCIVASAERDHRVRADFDQLRAHGAEVIELPMVRSIQPRLDLRHVRMLSAALRRLRPDIVHSHSSKAGGLARASSLASRVGIRVHTPHAFAFLFGGMFSRHARGAFWTIERALAWSTSAFIAVSRGEADSILRARVAGRTQVHVVPNGIDPQPIRNANPLTRAELGVPPGVPTAAIIGLLNEAKGQDVAIRALGTPGCENVHLLIVGEGETEDMLRTEAHRCGVASRVRFLGWRDDVPRILAAVDFLCLPSRWEAMPYVALEAMAACLPIIATRVNGVVEVVEDGVSGFSCDVDSPTSLGNALRRAVQMSQNETARMRREASNRLDASFTIESMARRTRQVYLEALDSSRRKRAAQVIR